MSSKIADFSNKFKSNPFTRKLYENSLNSSQKSLLETRYLSDDTKGYIENTIYGTNNIRNLKNFISIPDKFKETNEAKKLRSKWQSQDGGRKTRKKRKYKKRKYKKQTYKKKN